MRIIAAIVKYFWVVMLAGLVTGLVWPVYSSSLMPLLEPALILLLFLVFLKTDFIEILRGISNYRLMAFIAVMFLVVVPVGVFYIVKPFDSQLALGLLLLTAMPAGTATPALTDLMKGNVGLSMSVAIITSLLAPITVPLLMWICGGTNIDIDPIGLFRKLGFLVCFPLLLAEVVKRISPTLVTRTKPWYSLVNVIIFGVFVYATIGSQQAVILKNPLDLVGQVVILYGLFFFLHLVGYFMGWKLEPKDRLTLTISRAYMNNGMAIVLAARFFDPEILILMILSEFPWNTLPVMLQKMASRLGIR
ncbi:MAG: bile acid:sodium symporter [Bacteroidia bacterium]|nr:bile acid:sodium symporter [Bacteroidia bacterium]